MNPKVTILPPPYSPCPPHEVNSSPSVSFFTFAFLLFLLFLFFTAFHPFKGRSLDWWGGVGDKLVFFSERANKLDEFAQRIQGREGKGHWIPPLPLLLLFLPSSSSSFHSSFFPPLSPSGNASTSLSVRPSPPPSIFHPCSSPSPSDCPTPPVLLLHLHLLPNLPSSIHILPFIILLLQTNSNFEFLPDEIITSVIIPFSSSSWIERGSTHSVSRPFVWFIPSMLLVFCVANSQLSPFLSSDLRVPILRPSYFSHPFLPN